MNTNYAHVLAISAIGAQDTNTANFAEMTKQMATRKMIKDLNNGFVSFTRTPAKNQRQRRKMWANNPRLRNYKKG